MFTWSEQPSHGISCCKTNAWGSLQHIFSSPLEGFGTRTSPWKRSHVYRGTKRGMYVIDLLKRTGIGTGTGHELEPTKRGIVYCVSICSQNRCRPVSISSEASMAEPDSRTGRWADRPMAGSKRRSQHLSASLSLESDVFWKVL